MLDSSRYPEKVLPGDLISPLYDIDNNNEKIVYSFHPGPGTTITKYKINSQEHKVLIATLKGFVHFEELVKTNIDSEGKESEKKEENDTENKNKLADELEAPEVNSDRIIKKYTVIVSKEKKNEMMQDPNLQEGQQDEVNNDFANNLPKEGDIVLCKVTRISAQKANVEILVVENNNCLKDSGVGTNGAGVSSVTGGSGAVTFFISQASSDLGETFKGVIRSQDVRATERDSVKITECFKPGDIVRCKVLSLGDGNNYYLTTAKNYLGVVFAKSLGGAGELMYAIDWKTMIAPTSQVLEQRKCAKPF
ncbi:related to Exosome complex component CSL4 [Saccharomycodes ludwigii]|uniref:Related to Exosome complex component CSL4 n=1 Tax=Saccharomycodes ludwigii TaxID=36035 RepID=A0A376B812_9ASCO|nr:hypothetical protein SCDLUD_003035 [Saccharomycodes ludwigii]KAH3901538.1 hypothetical protein SCDLUD_003035 [Saccharomycodes ludwigii]SSD60751.1 related to Exosome complex component CSL4 [Saccharomycodes ludwigii]